MESASLQRPRIGALARNTPSLAKEEWPGGTLATDLSVLKYAPPFSPSSEPLPMAGPRQVSEADSESMETSSSTHTGPPLQGHPLPGRGLHGWLPSSGPLPKQRLPGTLGSLLGVARGGNERVPSVHPSRSVILIPESPVTDTLLIQGPSLLAHRRGGRFQAQVQ